MTLDAESDRVGHGPDRMQKMLARFALTCLLLGAAVPAWAQSAVTSATTIRVFFDCPDNCDFDFIRKEIDYVDYVRDRTDAELHVLVTTRDTGTGGNEYSLKY